MTRGRIRRLCTPRCAKSSVPHSGTRGILPRPVSVPLRLIRSMSSPPFALVCREPAQSFMRCRNCGAACGAASERGSGTSRTCSRRRWPVRRMRTGVHCGTRSTCVPCSSHPVSARKRSVRSAAPKTRRPRIPSVPGNVAFPSGQPRPIPVCYGAARLYSFIDLPSQARPVPYPVPHGPGAFALMRAHVLSMLAIMSAAVSISVSLRMWSHRSHVI